MMYVKYPLSLRNVEDLLFEHGALLRLLKPDHHPPMTRRLPPALTVIDPDAGAGDEV
jgi:hypothetical protein